MDFNVWFTTWALAFAGATTTAGMTIQPLALLLHHGWHNHNCK